MKTLKAVWVIIVAAGLCTNSTAFASDQSASADTVPVKASSKAKKRSRKEKQEELASKNLPPARPAIRGSQEESPIPESPQEEETRLTKNWGGARSTLSDQGIDLAVIYKGDLISNRGGGIKKATGYLANVDVRTSVDAEKLIGWRGGSFFLYLLGDYGDRPNSDFVGSSMGVDNIETDGGLFKVYELWMQQLFYENRMSLLIGLHDLNSEFYVTDSSTFFIHPNFGIGTDLSQSGVNGPSIFPSTSMALRLRTEPSQSFYMQWAIFNAVSGSGDPENPQGSRFKIRGKDGQLLITEAAYLRGQDNSGQRPGKYGMGAWAYTSTFKHQSKTVLNPEDPATTIPVATTSYGAYFLLDQTIVEGFSFFARYGLASAQANRFSSALGTGVVFTGLIPTRGKDRLGLALARANNGSEYKQSKAALSEAVDDAETTFELTYRFEALRGIAIQPDFQYVINPGTNPALSNAKLVGARFEISL